PSPAVSYAIVVSSAQAAAPVVSPTPAFVGEVDPTRAANSSVPTWRSADGRSCVTGEATSRVPMRGSGRFGERGGMVRTSDGTSDDPAVGMASSDEAAPAAAPPAPSTGLGA